MSDVLPRVAVHYYLYYDRSTVYRSLIYFGLRATTTTLGHAGTPPSFTAVCYMLCVSSFVGDVQEAWSKRWGVAHFFCVLLSVRSCPNFAVGVYASCLASPRPI